METGRSRSCYPHVKTREAFRAKQRAISAALPAQEREANRVAADNCVPTQEMISFVSRRKFFAERDIVALANKERRSSWNHCQANPQYDGAIRAASKATGEGP